MPAAGRVSALGSPELRAIVLSLKQVERGIRKDIRTETRTIAVAQWQDELARRARTEQAARMLVRTARVKVSDQNVTLTSASSKRKALSGGATPYRMGKAWEFGSPRTDRQRYGWPAPNRAGYVFYPAAAVIIPRLLALWGQIVFRRIAESLEGESNG